MATPPRPAPKPKVTAPKASERLTPLERAIERAHIDVAAIIRWTLIGLAAVITALYPFFTGSAADAPTERAKTQVEKIVAATEGGVAPKPISAASRESK